MKLIDAYKTGASKYPNPLTRNYFGEDCSACVLGCIWVGLGYHPDDVPGDLELFGDTIGLTYNDAVYLMELNDCHDVERDDVLKKASFLAEFDAKENTG